jgi:hypothetical protein
MLWIPVLGRMKMRLKGLMMKKVSLLIRIGFIAIFTW